MGWAMPKKSAKHSACWTAWKKESLPRFALGSEQDHLHGVSMAGNHYLSTQPTSQGCGGENLDKKVCLELQEKKQEISLRNKNIINNSCMLHLKGAESQQ